MTRDRSQSIGASEVAALFHCHPWESEYSLWCRKTGLLPPREDTERLRVGRFLERAVLKEWCDRHGVVFEHNAQSIVHPVYEFISATPDGLAFDGDDVVDASADVKTVEPMRRHDWDDGVPLYYRLQKQQQMLVTGANRGVLIALFGFNELAHEWIDADPDVHRQIIERCNIFWRRVTGDLPPPEADGHDATTEALKAREHGAAVIQLGEEVRAWTDEIEAQGRRVRALENDIAAMQNKIRAALGSASVGVFPDGSGWRIQTINRKEYVSRACTYTKLLRLNNNDAVESEQ